MQEQINEKSVALYIKTGKLTGRVLAKALQAAVRRLRNPKARHGKQTVKQLARKGGGLQNIEVTDSNIKAFERSAREFGVDFALKREKDDPTRWVVFFQAKDAATMTAAFEHFIGNTLGKKQEKKRPSLLGQIARFKELVKNTPAKEKNKDRGGHEL